jgi:hypothetical protein
VWFLDLAIVTDLTLLKAEREEKRW